MYYLKYMESGAHVGYVRDKVVPAVCSHFKLEDSDLVLENFTPRVPTHLDTESSAVSVLDHLKRRWTYFCEGKQSKCAPAKRLRDALPNVLDSDQFFLCGMHSYFDRCYDLGVVPNGFQLNGGKQDGSPIDSVRKDSDLTCALYVRST